MSFRHKVRYFLTVMLLPNAARTSALGYFDAIFTTVQKFFLCIFVSSVGDMFVGIVLRSDERFSITNPS